MVLIGLQDWQNYGVINKSTGFNQWLEANYPGTIIYDGQAPEGSTIQRAYNKDVAGLADSSTFADPGDNPIDADATGATPAQTFGGNIPYAWSYDGVDDWLGNSSVELQTGVSLTTGEFLIFGKVPNAGFWTDGNEHALMRATSGTDIVDLRKNVNNNTLVGVYKGGGVQQVSSILNVSTLSPFMLSLEFGDVNNSDFATAHFNSQSGSTVTGFGASGAVDNLYIGAAGAGTPWNWEGLLSLLIYSPTPFTANERADIYQRSGI